MLEKIICYLVDLVKETKHYEKVFPFARMITSVGTINGRSVPQYKPAQYTTAGQLDDVSIFDHHNGVAYFRLTGKTTVSTPVRNQVPCTDELKFDFPVRFVGCVKKSQLPKDDAFAEHRAATSMISSLSFKHSELTKELQAREVTFTPTNVALDGQTIANEEYRNYGIIDVNYNYAYVAIDFTASVSIKLNCITNNC